MGSLASLPRRSVAEAMLRAPKTHDRDITVAEARRAFADAHVHMLLLTQGGVLHGTLVRVDLEGDVDLRRPAIELATLAGRTIGPDQHLDVARQLLSDRQTRRLAVIDIDHTLLGLLCLKRTLHDYCDDSDVLARTREQPAALGAAPAAGEERAAAMLRELL